MFTMTLPGMIPRSRCRTSLHQVGGRVGHALNHMQSITGGLDASILSSAIEDFLATMNNLQFPSPILNVSGFSNRLIWDDSLHVAYRGFAADVCGSMVADMFGKQGALLSKAGDMLHSWARANGHELAMDEFSFSDDYPSLNAKGWDIKLVCMWLAFWWHANMCTCRYDARLNHDSDQLHGHLRQRSHLLLLALQQLLGDESMHT